MGSFYSTCSVSNMTLTNQKNCDEDEYDEINGMITSHERNKKLNNLLD